MGGWESISPTTESAMGLSTLVLGTAITVLPLMAAGLLAAMVLLERRAEPPSPAHAGRASGRLRARQGRPTNGRRRCG